MTAHVTTAPPQGPDASGIEAVIARRMPAILIGGMIVIGVAWWMAAQPPNQPPPWDPSRQPNTWQQGPAPPGYPQQQHLQNRPPNRSNSACSDCSVCVAIDCADCMATDCVSGIDCADCMSGIDCGDCISCDCASGAGACAVAGTSTSTSTQVSMRTATATKSCATKRAGKLAESSGLLLPFFVLLAWRRRLKR